MPTPDEHQVKKDYEDWTTLFALEEGKDYSIIVRGLYPIEIVEYDEAESPPESKPGRIIYPLNPGDNKGLEWEHPVDEKLWGRVAGTTVIQAPWQDAPERKDGYFGNPTVLITPA